MSNRTPRLLALSFTLALALGWPAIAGADEDIERTRICHPGFARAGRPSAAAWTRLKAEAMARAGLPWSERNDFELDHVVPRCLDGPNTLENLQLQPWPEAEEKDHREAETCRAYCSGEISLEQARSSFKLNESGREPERKS